MSSDRSLRDVRQQPSSEGSRPVGSFEAKGASVSDALLELEDGWDSYKAPKPSERAVACARRFEALISPWNMQPVIQPSVVGGVGVTFRRGKTAHCYVEFVNDGETWALFSRETGDPRIVSVGNSARAYAKIAEDIRRDLLLQDKCGR